MPTINVTINDITQGPFSVASLFSLTPPAAVTVTPTATSNKPLGAPRIARQLQVQADGGNNATNIYWGDKNLTPATTETGIVLGPLGANQKQWVPLSGEFVNASANGGVVAIAADGGFQ